MTTRIRDLTPTGLNHPVLRRAQTTQSDRVLATVLSINPPVDAENHVLSRRGRLVRSSDTGLSVDITAAIAALAQPGEILVLRTVTDLVIGSGISFADRGSHVLTVIPEPCRLFAVIAV